MKRFRCELCGGSNLNKKNGAFVCGDCGVIYSLEEAKSLLVEVDDANEGDNRLTEYFELAQHAAKSDNWEEAESYCDRILEIDENDYKAWLLKGEAEGWQSTVIRQRIVDAAVSFVKAYNAAPDNAKASVRSSAITKMRQLDVMFAKLWVSDYKARLGRKEFASTFVDACLSPILLASAACEQMEAVVLDRSTRIDISSVTGQGAIRVFLDKLRPFYPLMFDAQEYAARSVAAAAVVNATATFCQDRELAAAMSDASIATLESVLSSVGTSLDEATRRSVKDTINVLWQHKILA